MNKKETQKPLFYRIEEVAHLLGLGKSKTYLLVAGGEIPSIRIGKSVRVPVSCLEDWVNRMVSSEQKTPTEN